MLRWMAAMGVAAGIGLLAQGAAWLEGNAPAGWGGGGRRIDLRAIPIVDEDGVLIPDEIVAGPVGPALAGPREEHDGAEVHWLRRCGAGDALVTVERRSAGTTWVVVRRDGQPCFQLPFPDGPERAPAALQLHGTTDPAGDAGPLAIVYSHALQPRAGEDGRMIRREEIHLILVGLDGRLLFERAFETRATSAGSSGSALNVAPLIWDGETLVAWTSERRWEAGAAQCLGSLLRLPRQGPVLAAEGVPCEPTGAIDADGDGAVEIAGATVAGDGPPWEAIVTTAGDFAATWGGSGPSPRAAQIGGRPALLVGPASPLVGGRLVRWPWSGQGSELPADEGMRFAFDWDGDGDDEIVLATPGGALVVDAEGRPAAAAPGHPLAGRIDGGLRELLLLRADRGVVAVAGDGRSRTAPGDMGVLASVISAGSSFDWTGDGTPDVTMIGRDVAGALWLAVWAENDLSFAWQAEALEELPARHQAPRVLALTGAGRAEVLVATQEGFAVRAMPEGELRWRGLAAEGVLDAWALPVGGRSAIAVR